MGNAKGVFFTSNIQTDTAYSYQRVVNHATGKQTTEESAKPTTTITSTKVMSSPLKVVKTINGETTTTQGQQVYLRARIHVPKSTRQLHRSIKP